MAKSHGFTIHQDAAIFMGGETFRAGQEGDLQARLDAQFEGKPAEQRTAALERLGKLGQVQVHQSGRVSGADIDQDIPPAKARGTGKKMAELTDADPTLHARREMGERFNGAEEHQNGSADPGDMEDATERVVLQPGSGSTGTIASAGDQASDGEGGEAAKPKAKPRQRNRSKGKAKTGE